MMCHRYKLVLANLKIPDRISVSFGSMAGRFFPELTEEVLEDTSLRIKQILSESKDLDYAKAITDLSKSLALQALQLHKISQLTLQFHEVTPLTS